MSDIDQAHEHQVEADPADNLAWLLMELRDKMREVEHAARSISCPGCDPDGARTMAVRETLFVEHDTDFMDAELILSMAADVREAVQVVTGRPHCHHEDDDEEPDDD